MCETQVEARME